MNVQEKWPTTPDEFLRWNQGREGKREFVHGKVVELMINVTRTHFFVASRLMAQIIQQLGLDDFIIGSADFGVRTLDGVRYPDVLVERVSGDGKALATAEPLMVAEVLSPSTMHDDFGPKATDYLAIESLQHYVVLAQDEPRIWFWSRDDEGAFGEPVTTDETTTPIVLDGLGITLDLAALYKGIADGKS